MGDLLWSGLDWFGLRKRGVSWHGDGVGERRGQEGVGRGFHDVGGRIHGFLLGWGRLLGSTLWRLCKEGSVQ